MTGFGYDKVGRLTKITSALGYVTRYEYDGAGNKSKHVDANGIVTEYLYNANGQLIKTKYSTGKEINYSYDITGRLTGYESPEITGTRRYDLLGRMTVESNISIGKAVHFGYDISGNLVELLDPEKGMTRYGYDKLNNLNIISNDGIFVSAFGYDKMSRKQKQTNANKTRSIYQYDNAGNLLSLIHYNPSGSMIEKFCYQYDKVGNRLTMTNLDGPVKYTYDKTYQVLKAEYPDGQTEQFMYDPAGNRKTYLKNNQLTTYTYDADNRLLQSGNAKYEYDPAGNQVKSIEGSKVQQYKYNEDNLLSQYSESNTSAEYGYDPFGRRISKTINEVKENYIYRGDDIIAEYDTGLNVKTRYVMNPQKVDDPIIQKVGNNKYWFLKDGLGSVISLIDDNGNPKNEYKYFTFGGNRAKKETMLNRYQYTSRENDAENSLYYYRSRMYIPGVGRFNRKDDMMDGNNWYIYVANNPVIFYDSLGNYSFIYYPDPKDTSWYTYCNCSDTPYYTSSWSCGSCQANGYKDCDRYSKYLCRCQVYHSGDPRGNPYDAYDTKYSYKQICCNESP